MWAAAAATAARFSKRKLKSSRIPNKTTDTYDLTFNLCGVRAESDKFLHFSTCACHPSRVPMLEHVTPLFNNVLKAFIVEERGGRKHLTPLF